jgi:hypothetical protein
LLKKETNSGSIYRGTLVEDFRRKLSILPVILF